jgi:hypothetical protein
MAGCKLNYDAHNGDYDCGYGSELSCDECKYGVGRKDPEAWANMSIEDRREHANELRRIRHAKN